VITLKNKTDVGGSEIFLLKKMYTKYPGDDKLVELKQVVHNFSDDNKLLRDRLQNYKKEKLQKDRDLDRQIVAQAKKYNDNWENAQKEKKEQTQGHLRLWYQKQIENKAINKHLEKNSNKNSQSLGFLEKFGSDPLPQRYHFQGLQKSRPLSKGKSPMLDRPTEKIDTGRSALIVNP
jgi:hypothetical protein